MSHPTEDGIMGICPPVVAATQNSENFVSINDMVKQIHFMTPELISY